MGHVNCCPINLMWAIILCHATFVLKLIFNVLVDNLHEDLGECPRSWTTHMNSALTRKLVWPALIFHPHL